VRTTRSFRRIRVGAALAALLAHPSTAFAQAKPMQLEDLGRVVRVSDAQIAPDGKSVLVIVGRVNYEENRSILDLVEVNVASGAQKVLLHDRRGLSSPRWSPDGDRIAFLGTAENDAQLFVLPHEGGDATRITSAPGGVQHFAWRPNGKDFAFVAAVMR
jgi:dipeptidyl aminopeptidase/acylaminoacyl peptidase